MKLRIVFLVKTFPSVSETFILNQVIQLLDVGHDVQVFATHRPDKSHVQHKLVGEYDLLSRTTYRPHMPEDRLARIAKAVKILAENPAKAPVLLKTLNVARFGELALSLDLFYTAVPFLDAKEFDIIHGHFGMNGVKAAAIKSLGLLRGKLVTTFYGYDVNSKYISAKSKSYYNQLISMGDGFSAGSGFLHKKALKFGFPEEKIARIPMGIDTQKFTPDFKDKETRDNNLVRFVSVGRLVEMKGFEYSIRAFERVVHQQGYKNVHYTIIGEGTNRPRLEDLINKLNLTGYITLAGAKTQEEVKAAFQLADVFVLPSVNSSDGTVETQGLVIQEAEAMMLPVLISDVGGVADGLIDGETGFLFPEKDVDALAEKMVYMINNPAEAKKMGAAGRKFVVENYDIKVMGKKMEDLYFRVLNNQLKKSLK